MTPNPEKWTPKSKHTPEPWYFGLGAKLYSKKTRKPVPFHDGRTCESYANAVRLVACVNACADIPDPEKAIKAARIALAEAINNMAFYGPGVPVSWREALALLGGQDARRD